MFLLYLDRDEISTVEDWESIFEKGRARVYIERTLKTEEYLYDVILYIYNRKYHF